MGKFTFNTVIQLRQFSYQQLIQRLDEVELQLEYLREERLEEEKERQANNAMARRCFNEMAKIYKLIDKLNLTNNHDKGDK